MMKRALGAAILVALFVTVATWVPLRGDAAERACRAEQGLEFVCGVLNVEDMIRIPGSSDLIGSGMAAPGAPAGHLYWIDTQRRRWQPLIPSVGKVSSLFSACPSSFDATQFKPHGIALAVGTDGQPLLYVVNHGGRESIEMFTVVTSRPISLQWVGCVVLPEGASGNGVAPLPDGGFAATQFFDTRRGDWLGQLKTGQKTGAVYLWHPGRGFNTLPGSEASGDNGIEVSHDGNWLYVNMWPEKRVVRFALNGEAPPRSIALDFMPDNIHAATDGSLLVGGHIADIQILASCKKTDCPVDWSVARLNPNTLEIEYLLWNKGTENFQGVTGALEVNGRLWLSTFRGDRIASTPTPTRPLDPER